jgi:hypothetical protein
VTDIDISQVYAREYAEARQALEQAIAKEGEL